VKTPEELVRTTDGLVIRCLRDIGPFENNIFTLSDRVSGEGYIVDAGYEPQQVAHSVKDVHVRGILITHGHHDHHEHVDELRELVGAPVLIGADDSGMLASRPDGHLLDGQHLPFGSYALEIIHTPGHTPGSMCLLVHGHLFTGDTLFPGGPGNTQQDPERFARIIRSIRERLFSLPDETVVHPGHGRDTSIGAERPHLDEWIARGW
jgi:glyoxylase-like metal-dependent hydrolase (beta-lactamase superfamily II)